MTETWLEGFREWLIGRDTSDSRLYDLYEILPVWKTKWFQICVAAGIIFLIVLIWWA